MYGAKSKTKKQELRIEKIIQSEEGFAQNGRVYGVGGVSPTLGTGHAMSEVKILLEAYPYITPEREEKRKNGRRLKRNSEEMFTLKAQDKHGVMIKEATKQGFTEARPGDSVNLQFLDSETRRGRVGVGKANTLLCNDGQGVVTEDLRIRKLTPKECFRLQGWTDDYFEKAAFVNSDSQLYKQAGNGVTVNVIYEIARFFE